MQLLLIIAYIYLSVYLLGTSASKVTIQDEPIISDLSDLIKIKSKYPKGKVKAEIKVVRGLLIAPVKSASGGKRKK